MIQEGVVMTLFNREEVVIRPFAAGDRELVQDFFDRMGPESRALFNRRRGNELGALAFFDEKEENKSTIRFMAELNGRMVGYLFFFSYEYKIPWLGIAVSDDVKGMHLGTRLMEFAKNYAMAHGKGGILLTTHQANLRGQMLYENSGYERLGNHYSGEVMYILRFED